jgi:hypothetical protein
MSGRPEQDGSMEGCEGRRKAQGREMAVFLRAVSAAAPDRFLALVMLDFDRVAIEDRDDGAGEVGSCEGSPRK